MVLFGKKITIISLILVLFTVKSLALSNEKNISFFLIPTCEKNKSDYFQLKLIIDNFSSNDTIYFSNFSKYIPHVMEKKEGYNGLTWELKTLRGNTPEHLIVTGYPRIYLDKKINLKSKNDLIILPDSIITIDILLFNLSIQYYKNEYYILYLYYDNGLVPVYKTTIYYDF